MGAERVDTYYYTAVQSTDDYSQPQGAHVTEPTHRADAAQASSPTPEQTRNQQPAPVRLYFYDGSLGQYVNLLV